MILSKARFSYLCQKELYQTKSSGSFHCYVLTRISSSLQPSLLDEPRHSKHERLFSFHEEKRIFSIHKSLRRLCTIHYLLSNSMVQCTYAREFQYKEEIWFNQKQEMVSFWPFGLRSLFFSLSLFRFKTEEIEEKQWKLWAKSEVWCSKKLKVAWGNKLDVTYRNRNS